MAAPTFVEYDESSFSDNGNIDETSSTATWQSGDRVLVFGTMSNNEGKTLSTPTTAGSGLTFGAALASVNVDNANNATVGWLWTAVASGAGSGTITAASPLGTVSLRTGIAVLIYRGSDGLGTPVTLDTSTAKTISVTTTQANSVVAVLLADWAEVGDVTVTATPSGTVRHASAESGQADFFVVTTDDLGAIGTYACGIANHTGTVSMSGIAVEIKGTAGGGGGDLSVLVVEGQMDRSTF